MSSYCCHEIDGNSETQPFHFVVGSQSSVPISHNASEDADGGETTKLLLFFILY